MDGASACPMYSETFSSSWVMSDLVGCAVTCLAEAVGWVMERELPEACRIEIRLAYCGTVHLLLCS